MKSYQRFKNEKKTSLDEGPSIAKLKRLNLVSDDEFNNFIRVMKKMDKEQPVPLKDKDIIMKVFNELVSTIVSDQALIQKIAKKKDKED